MKKRFTWPAALALVLCGLAIGAVLMYGVMDRMFDAYLYSMFQPQAGTDDAGDYDAQTEKLSQLLGILDYYFVEDVDTETLVDAAAEGMVLGTGDRWSYYISADDMAEYTEQVTNSYAGIGITISADETMEDTFVVREVSAGGPAESAGVQVGDVLAAIEGVNTAELDLDEIKARVRGEAGTDVALTFLREGEPYDVTITRGTVTIPVATGELLSDNVGLITIENFDEGCAQETIQTITELMEQGAESLIFDVRNNPGGLRTELTTLLDYLLPEGIVFQSVDYKGDESTDYSDPSFLDLPMVVLVNDYSYSAAEFFAACLQEYGAAEVVGTQTCGKGYYQQTLSLSDGSAVAVSMGAYYTPSGKSLIDVGVTPDVSVGMDDEDFAMLYYNALDREDDLQLQAALELLNQ